MSSKRMATLVSKAFAIYSLIQSISFLQVVFFQIASIQSLEVSLFSKVAIIIGSILPLILLVILAGFLWYSAEYVTSRLFPEDQSEIGTASIRDIEVLAFSVIGVFVIVNALPNLSAIFFNYWFIDRFSGNQVIDLQTKVKIYTELVQLIIGFIMILGSNGIVGLVKTLREAGIKGKH